MASQPEQPPATRWGHINELDRSFDLAYWQAQTSEARMQAVDDMVREWLIFKGRESELRVQRNVIHFGIRRS